jgi:hypothetical protein
VFVRETVLFTSWSRSTVAKQVAAWFLNAIRITSIGEFSMSIQTIPKLLITALVGGCILASQVIAQAQPFHSWRASQPIAENDRAQDVLVNADGVARILWIEPNSTELRSTLYDPSQNTWTTQTPVSLGSAPATSTNLGLVQKTLPTYGSGRSMVIYTSAGCLYAMPVGVLQSQFGSAQQVTTDCGAIVNNSPNLAIDTDGNVTLAWVTQRRIETTVGSSFVQKIFVSRYAAEAAQWSAPQEITSISSQRSSAPFPPFPKVAANCPGEAVVAWGESAAKKIMARHFSDGVWETTTHNVTRNVPNTFDAVSDVVMDCNGDAILTTFNRTRLSAFRYNASSPPAERWGAEVLLDGALAGGGNNVMTMDREGNAWIVWRRSNVTGALYARRYNAKDVTWDAAQNIASNTRALQVSSLVTNAGGRSILTYTTAGQPALGSTPAQTSEAFFLEYNFLEKAVSPTVYQHAAPVVAGAVVNEPKVAINDRGSAVITWQQRGSGTTRTSYAVATTLPAWTTQGTRLTENDIPSGGLIKTDGKGNALAVWSVSLNSQSRNVFSRYYDFASNAWGPQVQVNDQSVPAGDFTPGRLDMNTSGQGVLTLTRRLTNVVGFDALFVRRFNNGVWVGPAQEVGGATTELTGGYFKLGRVI